MFLFFFIANIFALLCFQFIFFRIFKRLNKINYTLVFFIFIIIFEFLYFDWKIIKYFEFLILNFTFLLTYYFFLTMLINGSPTLFLIEKGKKAFLERNFIGNRLKQLEKDKFIINEKITHKGIIVLNISKLLSFIFLKEKK